MAATEPGLENRLRAAGAREEGLEKAMAFAAVHRALVGDDADPLGLADALGKYRVLERLGSGGMGAVYAAWDPELERRVALKVLTGGTEVEAERALIMREAKAAAQLAHPNVVTVFEAGVAQGRVFLAMEYVRGQTLRAWARTRPPASDRLAVLLQAGRGLAAAHDRGLVHRDFKPDNVLVAKDGRAKVLDFGLAHSSAEAFEATSQATAVDAPSTITQTGSRSGTPGYMAPEQLRGAAADVLSDQFAFAVTAWEVLCGTRPFEDNAAPGEAHGRPVSGVPRSVMQALHRALSEDPARRFASMPALLDALDPAPRTARRNRWLAGGAMMLTVGAVAWGVQAQRAPLCTGFGGQLEGLWDDAQQRVYAAAFATLDPDAGPTAWAKTSATLDAYAQGWVATATETCEASRVRGELSEQMYDLRTRCLQDRLQALGALTNRFATLEDVDAAPKGARSLPAVDTCTDPAVLTAMVGVPPEDIATDVEQIRQQLADVRAADDLGQYQAAAEALPPLTEAAAALEHRPLQAEALYLQGRVARRMKTLPEARAALEQAVLHATASRHDRLLAQSLSLLALVRGYHEHDKEGGLAVADLAQAAIDRIGGDAELEAELAARMGIIYRRAGDLDQARSALERGAAGFNALRPGGVQYADSLNNLATISLTRGEWDRAADELQQALEIFERLHGPTHPAVAAALGNLATVYRNLERLDDARDSLERARAIFAEAHGDQHPRVAAIDLNLCNVALQAGDLQRGLELVRNVPERLQAALGEDHVWVANALSTRGQANLDTGHPEAARADTQRAVAIFAKIAPDNPELGVARCRLGSILAKRGERDAAREAFAEALAQLERILGEDAATHPNVLSCQALQAEVPSGP
jgi:tetratricopeptide (TPR) repeat protein/predicted Ser/Thr protein kinase